MTYNDTNLTPTHLNSGSWAVAWTRFYLRDTNNDQLEFSDAEVTATLAVTGFTPAREDDDNLYYRPHMAAASLIEAAPDRALRESLLGASVDLRNPEAIARSIRRAGRWIDDAITTATSEKPTGGRQLTPVF